MYLLHVCICFEVVPVASCTLIKGRALFHPVDSAVSAFQNRLSRSVCAVTRKSLSGWQMVNDPADTPQSGRFVDGEHRLACRVYFEDTDFTGVVYHANYLRFMERARSDMLRVAGINQRATHEAGQGAYAVAALSIRYRRPARLDDDLLVVSHIAQIRAASVVIHQRVICDAVLIADAEVSVAFLGEDGRPCRQPAEWIGIFRGLTGAD